MIMIVLGFGAKGFVWAGSWPSVDESFAFQQYLKRPTTELSKLIYLMDHFKDADAKIIYDGNEYHVAKALRYAKKYLADHYKSNEKATAWLKAHAYRSQPKGNVIYAKFPEGKFRPMVEVLLETLTELEKTVSKAKMA